jgi:hypothetical protein
MFLLTRVIVISGINLLLFTIAFAQIPSVRTASISGRVTVSGNPAAIAVVTAIVAQGIPEQRVQSWGFTQEESRQTSFTRSEHQDCWH